MAASSPRGGGILSAAAQYWVLETVLHPADEEVWGLFCLEHGATGAEWVAEGESRITVRHYFDRPPPGAEALVADFAVRYPHAGPPLQASLAARPVESWETAWRVHFQPLPVGRRLLIRPPWDAPDATPPADTARERLAVVINPGRGFGTGWHPSTRLALELVEELLLTDAPAPSTHRPPEAMLDVGTGSGILAIAARLLGVKRAVALDLDGDVFGEVRANFALSALAPPPWLVRGGPDCLRGAFPLVTANITADILLARRAQLARLTAPGGCLMVSGILESERAALLAGFGETGLLPERERRDKGWWAGRLRRKD